VSKFKEFYLILLSILVLFTAITLFPWPPLVYYYYDSIILIPLLLLHYHC